MGNCKCMNFAFRFLNLDPLYNVLIDLNATIPVTNFNYLLEHYLSCHFYFPDNVRLNIRPGANSSPVRINYVSNLLLIIYFRIYLIMIIFFY